MSVAAARCVLGSKAVSTYQVNTPKRSVIKRTRVVTPAGLGGGVSLSLKNHRAVRQHRSRFITKSASEEELDTSYVGTEPAPERESEEFAVLDTGKWECKSCQYVYDESQGDPDFPVAAGTKFRDTPDDYRCPVCGVDKNLFVSKSQEVSGFAQNQGYGLGGNSMTEGQKSLLIYGSLFIFFSLFIAGYLLD